LKKTVAYLSALAALGGGVYLGAGALKAQQPAAGAPAASPARTKIGLINMAKVLKRYEKGNAAVKTLQDTRNTYIMQVNEKRQQINEQRKSLEKALGAQKDQIEATITRLEREIQDVDKKAQKELSQMSNDTLLQVYREIKSVVDAVAQAQDLDLILGYIDAADEQDPNAAVMSAQLKLQATAAIPLYSKPSMDVTETVVLTLNKHYPAPTGVRPAGATAPATGAPPAGTAGAGQPRQ
jgi:Skp family chaperone for outer membrane proteins